MLASDQNVNFSTVNDGRSDATRVLKKALKALDKEHSTLVLPAGTYLLTSSLKLGNGESIRGEGVERTFLKFKLKPGDVGLKVTAVDSHISDFSIDGDGDTAIQFKIPKSAHAEGHHINISGFKHAILSAGENREIGLEDISLADQKDNAIQNDNSTLTIQHLLSNNAATAIVSTGKQASLQITESELIGGAQQNFGITAEGNVQIRQLSTSGYRAALQIDGEAIDRINIDEFAK